MPALLGRPQSVVILVLINLLATAGAAAPPAAGRARRDAPLVARVAGTKSEPPSRPSVDWSRQRPHFGPDMQRELSVELGKTAYLTCKVFELGDKTVSWLRPRQNEILTAGKYTYIGDPRFAPINNNGSHDWILEIRDVALNDSTSYECQVSTDPKMSAIINLHVKAGKSRIRQGEHYSATTGANIEFSCEIVQPAPGRPPAHHQPAFVQQIYWYFNGNLINYARAAGHQNNLSRMNFSIEFDQQRQLSRLKLFNIQANEAGNYTCKPTSAEPSSIRLRVKKPNKSLNDNRANYGPDGGVHLVSPGAALRNRQQYGFDSAQESTSRAHNRRTSAHAGWLLCSILVSALATYTRLMRPTPVINCSLPVHRS